MSTTEQSLVFSNGDASETAAKHRTRTRVRTPHNRPDIYGLRTTRKAPKGSDGRVVSLADALVGALLGALRLELDGHGGAARGRLELDAGGGRVVQLLGERARLSVVVEADDGRGGDRVGEVRLPVAWVYVDRRDGILWLDGLDGLDRLDGVHCNSIVSSLLEHCDR